MRGLHDAGVELVSTGGSARLITDLGLPVTKVEDLTGFPECLDGRVKTLHPKVHAGILADRRLPTHVAELSDLGIAPFDLVVSNLYPFTETVMSGASQDECVEQIDIGGPSMVRAAAKNHPSVAIVTSPERYGDVLAALGEGGFTLEQRKAPGGRGVRAHRDLRRTRGQLDGQRPHRHLRRLRLPRLGGRDLGARLRPALRREPAPVRCALPRGLRSRRAGAGRSAARQGDVLQQLRGRRRCPACGVRLRRAGCRDHQARQPVWHRRRCRRRRGPPKGARVRPGLRVRWRDRGEPPGDRGDGASRWPRCSPRWSSLRRTTKERWRSSRARRTCACSSASRCVAAGPRPGRSPAAC